VDPDGIRLVQFDAPAGSHFGFQRRGAVLWLRLLAVRLSDDWVLVPEASRRARSAARERTQHAGLASKIAAELPGCHNLAWQSVDFRRSSGGIGRRIGLKIRSSARGVWVRVPSRPPDDEHPLGNKGFFDGLRFAARS